MASASVWGIDLGNRALKAVKLVREAEQYRIEDFVVLEHEQPLSLAGDNKESLQKKALATFVERHQTRGSAVAVSVSGQSSFARFIKLPPVEPKKIPEIVRFEAIQQIPFPLDDVEWAYQLFQEKDSPDVEVGIFAMRKELVSRHISLFTEVGLNVQVVQMNPLATYNAMFYDEHVGQTTMFIDSGADNTDLIIADGETVWLRSLPIGGNNFTEALAKAFKLSHAKAEELKRTASTSKYAKQIFQAMRPVFADMVAEIQRSIGFYASVHREARVARIITLGSTFELPGLQKYLQQNLQLPAEKLDAFKALPPTDGKLASELAANVPTLVGAYGLALQGMGECKIRTSLLPERIRRTKMWMEKKRWFAAAAALFVLGAVGVAASYYFHDAAYARNEPVRSEYRQYIRQAMDNMTRWQALQGQGEEDRQKIRTLRTMQDYHNLWIDLSGAILTCTPGRTFEELRKIPREKRDVISIESMESRYWADLTEPLNATKDFGSYAAKPPTLTPGSGGPSPMMMNPWMMRPWGMNPWMMMRPGMSPWGGMGGGFSPFSPFGPSPFAGGDEVMGLKKPGAEGEAAPTTGRRGFLITIRGSTPRTGVEGGQFIDRTLVKNLLALTEEEQYKKGKDFFVARAELVRATRRLAPGADPNTATPSADTLDPDMLGGDPDLSSTAVDIPLDKEGKPLFSPYSDRNFPGETTEADTVFTVLAAVVLDPAAPKKKEDQAGSGQGIGTVPGTTGP